MSSGGVDLRLPAATSELRQRLSAATSELQAWSDDATSSFFLLTTRTAWIFDLLLPTKIYYSGGGVALVTNLWQRQYVLAAVIKAGASREHEILAEIRDDVFAFIHKMEPKRVMDTMLVSRVRILYIRSLVARSLQLQSIKSGMVYSYVMGIGEAEAFSERLKRELQALEAANVHTILENEPLVN
nr:kinesin-like protein KIN-14B [Ipomoea batatas]